MFRIFSIFNPFRKRRSEVEELELLEKEILYYDELRRSNLETEKRFISFLLIYSILAYIVASVFTFFYFSPTTSWLRLSLYTLSLVVFPLIIYLIKILLHKMFVWRVNGKEVKLKELRNRKAKLLDTVKETIPYAKAKEILVRFDPLGFQRSGFENPSLKPAASASLTPTGAAGGKTMAGDNNEVRRRSTISPSKDGVISSSSSQVVAFKSLQSNDKMSVMGGPGGKPPLNRGIVNVNHPPPPAHRMQLTRPILSQQRSFVDRMVDYLVGDGPENRFALICRRCYGHNGMAMAEEFEYLTYRCCYCGFVNQSKKQKPLPPPIESAMEDHSRPPSSIASHQEDTANHCSPSSPPAPPTTTTSEEEEESNKIDESPSPSPPLLTPALPPLDADVPVVVKEATNELNTSVTSEQPETAEANE